MPFDHYTIDKVIGKNVHREVYKVKDRRDKKQYVMKKVDLAKASVRERKLAEQEAKLLSQLRHPSIVSFQESFQDESGFLYIVTYFCEGGDLYTKLKAQSKEGNLLEETQIVEWFVQIAMALQYMHERLVLHRNLNTENIFLTKSNIIKVGGLSKARVLETSSDMATTLIGTPYYMSPELISNKPYNHKTDVWALGCCLYEMCALRRTFNAKDMASLFNKILKGNTPPLPSNYSSELCLIVQSMLELEPEKRPSAQRLLRHSYIKKRIALVLEETKNSRKSVSENTSLSNLSARERRRLKQGQKGDESALPTPPSLPVLPTPYEVTAAEVKRSQEGHIGVAGKRAEVVFDYEAQEPDELSLKKGDIVDILGEEEKGWWKGRISSKTGVFPNNFVKLIDENSVQVPPEILARGNLALEAYNNALKEGRTYVRRVPVMLIGQDRSGKTSLKKSLKGQRFNPDEDSTVGIDKDPSYFKVTTEIWKPGDKGEATNSDAAISYEYHAAQIIVSNLTPTEASVEPMNYEINPLSSVDESNQNAKEIAQEQDPSGRLPITDIESSPTHEFPSVSSESPDTDFQSSDAPRIDDASSPSDERKVPDEIAALVEKLLLEVNKAEEEKDIYSVLWDFGGQSVYYVTHPLFLTPRAMYLLVCDLSRNPHDIAKPILMEGMFKKFKDPFNLKTNQDYLDFWMTSVSSLANQDEVCQAHSGPTSDVLPEKLPPVFLVCTHADKPHGGADPFELAHEIFDTLQRKPYSGQLVEHVFVVDNTKSASQSECEEVVHLRQHIFAVAKELPQMKEAIPIKWLRYEKAIRVTVEEEDHKWISLETARKIASDLCAIHDDQEFLTLLNFLHDQRILIHFDDNAVLNDMVILDPQWLVDVFKKVITVKPYDKEERKFKELWCKFEKAGILDHTLLEHVWGPLLQQRETFESLIAIMQKFSLLCPWPLADTSCSKQYLVPSMLMSYPPQEVINLVASAQIPSLFLKFKSGQIPPSFFPRLVLQFFQWCLEEFPTRDAPQLFHNFARFYISSDTGCSVVLLCHFADVEVIFLGKSRDVAESVQPEVNLSAGVSHDSCDVSLACTVRNQLALMVDSMRNEFCWLKNMRCEVSFLCPVCSQGGAVDYCQNHRAQACKQEECLHFFSELELLKSKKIITCTRSAIAQDNRVQIKQFTPWFAFDCGKNEATSEDSDRLLPSMQTLVIQRPHESTLALPGDVFQTLQSPCSPQKVVVQLQEHLQLNQSSLNEPDPETKKWIRCLATEAKRSNRLDVVRHLREISPAGITGPLLPEQLDIQNIPVGQMMELTIDLSGGDEWRVVAEKLGLSPKQIRYLEKRTLNPCDAALAFISQRCSISVGELYDLLNECGLPVVADNL